MPHVSRVTEDTWEVRFEGARADTLPRVLAAARSLRARLPEARVRSGTRTLHVSGSVDAERLAAALAAAGVVDDANPPAPRLVEIPARFDGEDLPALADALRLDPGTLVRSFLAPTYRVAFLGFRPGFPYLAGLPDLLAPIERHATPRVHVPAGAIALAGGWAGIYPTAGPGGWHLIGSTDVAIWSTEGPLLGAGDAVRFLVR